MTAWPYPFWIAHRGAGKLAPENTLAAFRLGASHGFRAFECDVKLSADGVPFLLHDDTLDRTTSGSGRADALRWDELRALDAGSWHGARHAGEGLPSFESVARYCMEHGFALNVEIKPMPGTERETGRVVASFAAVRWEGVAVPPLLSSFKPEALSAARAAAPHLPRALLLGDWREGWLAEATSLGCDAIVAAHRLLDADAITKIHGAGMRALTYTVNDAAEAHRLKAAGIDGVITDEVEKLGPR